MAKFGGIPVDQEAPITGPRFKGMPVEDEPLPGVLSAPLEFMAGANRAVTETLDFLGPDQINAILSLSGSEKRVPTLTETLSPGTAGGFMDPGLGRDIFGTAGEVSAIGVGTGAALRKAAQALPQAFGGESIGRGVLRQAAATTPAQDIGFGALAGAGAEIGREVGGEPGAIIGSIGAPAVASGIKGLVQAMLPSEITSKAINLSARRSIGTPFAQRGQQLVEETGVELTPGAQLGAKFLTFAENAARQSGFTADDAFAVDKKISEQAVSHINKIIGKISPKGQSNEAIGEQVRSTIKGAVNGILKSRDELAKREYGQIRKMAGDRPVISFKNANREAQKIISEYSDVGGSDARKVVSQSKELIKNLGRTTPLKQPPKTLGPNALMATGMRGGELLPVDINTALKNRSFYSKASKGVGRLFEDISPGLDRQIAARLSRAIERDFDESADAVGGDIGNLLKSANQNYRNHMQSIEYIENSALGRVMGEDFSNALFGGEMNKVPPEMVMDRITRMTPSEMRISADILNRQSPETLQAVKRRYLERALDEATMFAPSSGQNTLEIDPNKFIRSLVKNKKDADRMKALFTKNEMKDIETSFEVLSRWADTFGKNFSGTAPMNEFLDSMTDLSAKGIARTALRLTALKKVVAAMGDPTIREAVLETRKMPALVGAKRLGSYVSNILSTDQTNEPTNARQPNIQQPAEN